MTKLKTAEEVLALKEKELSNIKRLQSVTNADKSTTTETNSLDECLKSIEESFENCKTKLETFENHQTKLNF